MYVKICGLTTLEGVRAAVDAGADAIGLVRCPSPRQVHDPDPLLALAEGVIRIAVFRTWSGEDLAGFDLVQAFRFVGTPPIPALRAVTRPVPLGAAVHPKFPVCAVFDCPGGGTGIPADPIVAARLAKAYPIALAGGLRPDTVVAAIRAVRPSAVDVSSGVERALGRKDPALIRRFVAAAKEES